MSNDNNLEWELPHDPEAGDHELIPAGFVLVPGTSTYEKLRAELIDRIQHLLQNDFEALTAILYRLDVPEHEAAVALKIRESRTAATALTDAVLRREVKRREHRHSPGSA